MSKESEKFAALLAERIREAKVNTIQGSVVSVDEESFSCTVKCGNIELEDVRLNSIVKAGKQRFTLIPKKHSIVQITRIDASNEFIVLEYSEVERIQFIGEKVSLVVDDIEGKIILNDGENGGLGIVEKIDSNIDSIKKYIESMHAALPAAFSAIGTGSAANGASGKLSYDTAMATQSIQIADIENKKVTH